jgi:hypothetical protein
MPFTTFDTPHHDVLHFLLNYLPFLNTQPLHKFTHFPHRFLSVVLLGMFLNAVIGKMRESVVDVVEGILVVRKTKVTFLVKPYFRGIEVLD